MQKYTCIICGQEGETRNLGRLYCSSGNCAGCGWNPDVIKERLRGLGG